MNEPRRDDETSELTAAELDRHLRVLVELERGDVQLFLAECQRHRTRLASIREEHSRRNN